MASHKNTKPETIFIDRTESNPPTITRFNWMYYLITTCMVSTSHITICTALFGHHSMTLLAQKTKTGVIEQVLLQCIAQLSRQPQK
jgi:hypothetical protein